jgi:lipid-binding SYLF domain-containing protein
MDTPDEGIPHDLLASAKCIAIIPGDKKFPFIFGGSYGRGVVTCRTPHGWSAPLFVAIDGGSVGSQIGGLQRSWTAKVLLQLQLSTLSMSFGNIKVRRRAFRG